MGEMWGMIGKKRFRGNWSRRIWLFDRLIWTVLNYGVEIWEWKKREGMEKVEERYLRWIFGLDRRVPGYLVREEIQREKLRERAGKRTWEFEKRLEEGKGSKLARICWEELKGRSREEKTRSKWKVERRKFFEDRRWMIGEMEKKREEREL